MTTIKRCVAVALASATLTLTAKAAYFSHYDVTTNIGSQVTNLFLLETDGGTGLREIWSFTADGFATTHMDVFFPSDAPIARSLFIGLTKNLSSDPLPDVNHIVLLMDDNAAALSQNISWPTLFRNTNETTLIQNLLDATTSTDEATANAGIDALTTFAQGDAITGIRDSLDRSYSCWFNMGGGFKAVAFSNGQEVGSGTSFQTQTPEPCSLAALGLGGLVLLRRRKKA